MFTSLENRLWLAVHLLYPNSSQAFDVYQALLLQSEDAFLKDNRIQIFSKLSLLFEKIPSVSSNLSFYEFEFDQIDQWKIIYKNSQKQQLVVFIGVLIFDLKISEIAPCVKLTKEKAQFLFHQIFKKISQNGSKAKYNEQLSYKKHNDLKISYLYTYENLVEYCLGQLADEEAAKVKMGIDLYPILQITKDEYQKIISQIQNLKVQRSNSTELKSKNKITFLRPANSQAVRRAPQSFSKNKKISAALVSLAIIVVASLYVAGTFNQLKKTDNSVVMNQVVKRPEFINAPPDIAIESLPKPAEPAPAEVKLEAPPSPPPTTVAAAEPAKVITAAAKGGLFRGTLVVKDLKGANEKLLANMASLGAKKAGEVELGWLKTNNLAYYHFTISDENITQANAYFKELGTLKIRFESHPRLIPAGNKRFIIEVKGN